MNPKPIIPRERAYADVDEAVQHYLSEASKQVALRFVDEIERAYAHIARHPAAGSTRFAHELDLPGLRAWPLRDYPYWVFYMECPESVDVWRVLHARRDVPAWLGSAL